jgi:hypothetical protein
MVRLSPVNKAGRNNLRRYYNSHPPRNHSEERQRRRNLGLPFLPVTQIYLSHLAQNVIQNAIDQSSGSVITGGKAVRHAPTR